MKEGLLIKVKEVTPLHLLVIGYSVGSRIKGFKKYDGKWKPQSHSRYISTIFF
jgi:hypothetical protein